MPPPNVPDPAELKARIAAALPDARVEVIANAAPGNPGSLLLDPASAREVAAFLRDDPALRFDFCSNATGIDWPAGPPREKGAAASAGGDAERAGESAGGAGSGCLEVVYHLFSTARRAGPAILRLRTRGRADGETSLPSLVPVFRSAELQEREIFDLFGVRFDGHPDLRRLLMWEEFADHPMRKDYVAPDDYEYEPTPHDAVLERVTARAAGRRPETGPA